MNHQEYTERRDEITKRYVNNPVFEPIAAQAIDALVLEVIGKDINAVERNAYAQITKYDEIGDHQNSLRTEQRRIVTGDK